MVEIVDYEEKYSTAFRDISVQWISHYFKMEAEDYKYLEHPQQNIIDKGGAIIVALLDRQPVGVCALLKMKNHQYELAKMGVLPEARGKKIGQLLGEAILEKGIKMGATSFFLESNRKLTPAISLYRKLGFQEICSDPSPYSRCDIQMEKKV